MKDVCIWLAASFSSAAPYPGSLHIRTVCSKALLREYLHCLCLQNRKKEEEQDGAEGGKNISKLLPSAPFFLQLHSRVDPSA